MSDITTYIHMGVTVITTLSTVFLAYIQYRDKKVTKEVDISQDLQQKLSDLEINQAVLTERLNNNIEFTSKMDEKIESIMVKKNE